MISFHGTFTAHDLRATLDGLGPDIFFVQIGAMDGVTYDPINPFVIKYGWRGLLVEPLPYLNKRLQETYRDCAGLAFAEMAVADYEGEIEMVYIPPEVLEEEALFPALMGASTIMHDRGVFCPDFVRPEVQALFKHHVQKISVPCCRLPVLLKEKGVESLDLLVVDTEGADWMVVRQLPLDRMRPRLVYLEYNHLSDYEKMACAMHFKNHGYRIYIEKDSGENFLAICGQGGKTA